MSSIKAWLLARKFLQPKALDFLQISQLHNNAGIPSPAAVPKYLNFIDYPFNLNILIIT
jgi:hypothetical protein